MRAEWKFKLIVIPLFLGAFFAAYFLVLKSPLFPVTVMPLTVIDRIVPFSPGALFLYVSLWIYVPLVFHLLNNRAEFLEYGRVAVGVALVGLGIFVVWPTAVPLPDIDWEQHPAFASLKTVDATGNACPSLHVAFAVFSALWLHRLLREMGDPGFARALSWCWCAGIVYSTMATRQHVALDVLGGVALGIAGTALGSRRRYRTPGEA